MSRNSQGRIHQFKLVLLGESAVGKSSLGAKTFGPRSMLLITLLQSISLVMRFVKDHFDEYRESTIGAAFLAQTITLDDNTVVKFEIWDTAGQERYKSLAPMYYRGANCAVVMYDITQSSSLDKAKMWVDELQRQAEPDIVIALCGNKTDLESRRVVETNVARAYAEENGLLFIETSAKSAHNVNDLFTMIAKRLPLEQQQDTTRGGKRLNIRNGVDLDQSQDSNGCAC